ncbi:hypothetical protein vBBak6_095 [Bacillus phage v_B-Bak6]|uniref:Uncharacterized protein n=1 Tax=Bacillus phage Basilisk TaxID=1296654 RepID=S5MA56_9CAUD|nr:hypothetical protein PP653_gp063 [Bacillus phage Basilisk]AGR46644.1 hypothetical protein BASILISK_104 [Bacillus phage Basilisk]AXY83055.1 hypothetical protein vBBak1_095 [Bacillus phage v_B-Bak1]AXY83175.1 hypothetical protein vBBak6_095 [Bacillus phage v_B-Bak6]
MIETIKRLIHNFENGKSQLDIYDLALLIKEEAEDKLKEENENE